MYNPTEEPSHQSVQASVKLNLWLPTNHEGRELKKNDYALLLRSAITKGLQDKLSLNAMEDQPENFIDITDIKEESELYNESGLTSEQLCAEYVAMVMHMHFTKKEDVGHAYRTRYMLLKHEPELDFIARCARSDFYDEADMTFQKAWEQRMVELRSKKKVVTVTVEGGVVQSIDNIPYGISVEVLDFDDDGDTSHPSYDPERKCLYGLWEAA